MIIQRDEIIDIPIIDKENYRNTTTEEIQSYIRSLMNQCSIFSFLLGNNTHNGPWVLHEVNIALSRRMPIFAVQIPNTTGGLPPMLERRGIIVVEWNTVEIRDEINRLFGRS